jgi:hypothetical protein
MGMAAVGSPDAGVSARADGAPKPSASDDALTLFSALWAVASLFHVLGPSGRALDLGADVTGVAAGQALVAIAALVVLARPRRTTPFVVLALLGPITAWQEAPTLGNHWFVAALVDIGLLLALLAARRGWRVDRTVLSDAFLPVARWALVGFYAFAGFAKLNSAFFDTTVSCGNVYFDETARTLGFATPLAVGHGGWASLVPVGTALVELSIPVLLCIRRTRTIGVVVGLLFHSVIAIDQEHLFSDFSSLLSALFVLFLPAAFATAVLDKARGRARLAIGAWWALAAIVVAAQWLDDGGDLADTLFIDGRMWLWYLFDGALLATVGWWLLRARTAPLEAPLRLDRRSRWLAIVPVVVILNGFTPYLELKTAFSYNMYSNLTVGDGSSNHLVVRATLPVGSRLSGLVQVVSTNDLGLGAYAQGDYLLPWDSLRAYLSAHPAAAITYIRDGVTHTLARASDEPGLTDAPPTLVQKLLPLRAVDGHDPPRCQETFLPAL